MYKFKFLFGMQIEKPIEVSADMAQKVLNRIPNKSLDPAADMQRRTKTDFGALTFKKGDIVTIPESTSDKWVVNQFGSQVVVACNSGGSVSAKVLYFSSLDRTVALYDAETIKPTGSVMEARTDAVHDVFEKVQNCATDAEVKALIAGKTIYIADEKKGIAARYRGGEIVGTKERTIPVWDWVTVGPTA